MTTLHRVRLMLACLICILTVAVLPAMGGYLYVLNVQSGAQSRIFGYETDPGTGALTPVAGSPFNTGNIGTLLQTAESMAVDAERQLLYVLNDGPNTLSVYAIDPDSGSLSEMPYGPLPLSAASWGTIAVHPSGSPVVAGGMLNGTSGIAASFNISENRASAAAGSPFSTGTATPYSSTFSTDGNFFYTGGFANTTTFAGFAVDQGSGVLTPLAGSPFNSGGGRPRGLTTDADGRLFLVDSASRLRLFTTTGGLPTGVAGNPFTSVSGANDSVLHPGGEFLLATGVSANEVAAFRITGEGSSTVPVPTSSAPTGGRSASIVNVNDSGEFVYVANMTTRNIATLGFDSSAGALSFLSAQPQGSISNAGIIGGMALFEERAVVTSTPVEDIQAIIDAINAYDPPLQRGMARSFTAKLENAIKDLMIDDFDGAVDKLTAFVNQVRSQKGKSLTAERADALTAAALAVIDRLQTEIVIAEGLNLPSKK